MEVGSFAKVDAALRLARHVWNLARGDGETASGPVHDPGLEGTKGVPRNGGRR